MFTVYGRKSSANVQKVRWICSEGNLEFKTEIVGGKYGGLPSIEFISLHKICLDLFLIQTALLDFDRTSP